MSMVIKTKTKVCVSEDAQLVIELDLYNIDGERVGGNVMFISRADSKKDRRRGSGD